MLDLTILLACLLIGLRLQLRADGDRIRQRIWDANYVIVLPVAAAFAFLTVRLDTRLLHTVLVGLGAWWLTVALAGLYAALVTRDRPTRGALWLVAAFPNTGFIGYPLAQLAFGTDGLRLAIIYDQVNLVIPAIVVAAVIADSHAAPRGDGGEQPSASRSTWRRAARTALISPPLWSVLILVTLRLTLVDEPLDLAWLGTIVGAIVGPIGFLLLGLSLPRGGVTHERRELLEVSGAVAVRVLAAPALVWIVARSAGVDVPDALYLLAAMPTAFHAMVNARVYGLPVGIVRLGLVASTLLVLGATTFWLLAPD